MKSKNSKYICVGKIVNTHGLKGEVKLYPYLNEKEDYNSISTLIMGATIHNNKNKTIDIDDNELLKNGKKLDVSSIRWQKNMILLTFENINKIEDAEVLKNHLVYALKDDIDDEDGFFYSDPPWKLKIICEVLNTGWVLRIANTGPDIGEEEFGRIKAHIEVLRAKVQDDQYPTLTNTGIGLRNTLIRAMFAGLNHVDFYREGLFTVVELGVDDE